MQKGPRRLLLLRPVQPPGLHGRPHVSLVRLLPQQKHHDGPRHGLLQRRHAALQRGLLLEDQHPLGHCGQRPPGRPDGGAAPQGGPQDGQGGREGGGGGRAGEPPHRGAVGRAPLCQRVL